MRKLLVLSVLFLLLPSMALGQAKRGKVLSKEDFYAAVYAATRKFENTAYTNVVVETSFLKSGEKVSTWRTERDGLGDSRTVHTATDGKTLTRNELVITDGKGFCKRNDTEWIKRAEFCVFGPAARIPGNVYTEDFKVTVPKDRRKAAKEYREYIVFNDTWSFHREDPDQRSFYERIILVDALGRVTSETTKAGIIGGKSLDWTYVVRYTHGKKTQIIAPIK